MANEFVQGDTGILSLTIKDGNQIADLTNATVVVTLTYNHTGKIKQAVINDAVNGKCSVALNSDDLLFDGIYVFQAQVNYPDGRQFSSDIQKFTVTKKLGFIPALNSGGNSGGNTNIASGVNGHILVNGLDIKVYDDLSTISDISNLKANQHTHSNKDILDKLTQSGTDLLFNGSKIYDDTGVKNDISTLKNSDAVKRIGVSSNGKLTIDGVEVTLDDPTSPVDGGTFTTTYNTNIVDGGGF